MKEYCITLQAQDYKQLETMATRLQFDTPGNLVAYLIRELYPELSETDEDQDDELLLSQLKALGYVD